MGRKKKKKTGSIKKFTRFWLKNSLGLAVIGWVYPGLQINFFYKDFLISTILFSLIFRIVKPLFDIIFLPINILTLGMFRWLRLIVSFAIGAYLIAGIEVKSFYFPGFQWQSLKIPAYNVSFLLSMVLVSFLFVYIKKAIDWVLKG